MAYVTSDSHNDKIQWHYQLFLLVRFMFSCDAQHGDCSIRMWYFQSKLVYGMENGQYWDTNVMYFFTGQCGPGRADVLIVLSPHGWQAHHHHDQSQKSQSHGHHWSFRWVLTECNVSIKRWYSRLYTWKVCRALLLDFVLWLPVPTHYCIQIDLATCCLSPDPYVKVSLMCDGRRLKKRKTSTKRNTLNPVYNEAIVFDVPPENIDQISLLIAVMDYDRSVSYPRAYSISVLSTVH